MSKRIVYLCPFNNTVNCPSDPIEVYSDNHKYAEFKECTISPLLMRKGDLYAPCCKILIDSNSNINVDMYKTLAKNFKLRR